VRLWASTKPVDELTGLLSRGSWVRDVDDALSNPTKERVAVIVMNIDQFCQVNKTYGYVFGDEVLRQIGQVFLNRCKTRNAVPYSTFGDGLAVVLKGGDAQSALELAELLRLDVEGLGMTKEPVTVSAGVAVAKDGEWVEELFDGAEQAMYGAKRKGRNQVGVRAAT